MALLKVEEQENGVLADYWRITQYANFVDHAGDLVHYSTCVISLYVSKLARDNGKDPVKSLSFRNPPFYNGTPSLTETRAQWYVYLKTLPEFSGALDA